MKENIRKQHFSTCWSKKKKKKKKTLNLNFIFWSGKKKMENVYSFTAAVRGYHHYRKFWKPKENETCLFVRRKQSIRSFCHQNLVKWWEDCWTLTQRNFSCHEILSRSWSQLSVKLPSRHYRRSPLVQGGMEIACLVTAKIPATLKNSKLGEKYLELVKSKYTEPKKKKY